MREDLVQQCGSSKLCTFNAWILQCGSSNVDPPSGSYAPKCLNPTWPSSLSPSAPPLPWHKHDLQRCASLLTGQKNVQKNTTKLASAWGSRRPMMGSRPSGTPGDDLHDLHDLHAMPRGLALKLYYFKIYYIILYNYIYNYIYYFSFS